MHGGNGSKGYTIIEVMIFLAVSGVTFLIAATFISGKQSRSEFKQGVSEFTSSLQQSVGDIGNGLFSDIRGYNCTASPTPSSPTVDSYTFNTVSPIAEQGANKGCVFMGKVIQFQPSATNSATYDVVDVVGRQFVAGPNSLAPQTFVEARPILKVDDPAINLTERKTINWGVTVKSVKSSSDTIAAFGFYSSLAGGNSTSLNSGSQSVYTITVPNSSVNQSSQSLAGVFDGDMTSGEMDKRVDKNPEITICLDGGGGEHAYVKIGSTSGQRTVISSKITATADEGGCA